MTGGSFSAFFNNLVHGNSAASGATFGALLAKVWLWIIGVGYALSVIALFVIIYTLFRLFDLRKREDEFYGTLVAAPESAVANRRWEHIESLMEAGSPSSWREAITEADIMLDDMLSEQGYRGEGIGEKLRQVEPSDFDTLQDAWEAHKVRNQIAHEGSAFDLSETLARRTIARYESVFREFSYL
ncbi:MAG TPA: hypothetical protein VMV50_01210 [Candidatus Paceibacterota bacterium]|nr:hypothetical protein [Candidatus Paceibacterota bacterium]